LILRVVLRHLLRLNSEFAHYVPPECQRPRVELASLGDPAYFPCRHPPMNNVGKLLLAYHASTNHTPESAQSNRHLLDWANHPLAFKIYTSLEKISLPRAFKASEGSALDAIAGSGSTSAREPVGLGIETIGRLCYFSNGVTRVLRRRGAGVGEGMPFRAAACTGALYHIELYLICGDLADLEAGVYHYAAHDNALRQLRRGDYRRVLVEATGAEPSVVEAPVILAATCTYWRNAWKYQARAYRHTFWDTGTILANLFAVAHANAIPCTLVLGFADEQVNRLLDVDANREAAVCLVSLGRGSPEAPTTPQLLPLNLPTQPLSAEQINYPAVIEAHAASSFASGAAAAAWRHPSHAASRPDKALPEGEANLGESIEAVILRRGSSRRFARDPISAVQLSDMLEVATRSIPTDLAGSGPLTEPYLIVNAVEGLAHGTYVFNRASRCLELLKKGEFRERAAFLDLGQDLGGEAAVDVYWLSDLNVALTRLGSRGYRAAQLEAAIEGGKLYLAAYALGLGATGLTFFDDDVTRFFSPHAAGKSVMFLDAIGHPARRAS
jgi:SagB-type dehydrogenase family enzyme